jgi:putative transcriptional regulator
VNRIATTGPRRLVDGRWHDDNGPIADFPLDWDPPMTDDEIAIAAAADPDSRPVDKPFSDKARRVGLGGSLRFKLQLTHDAFEARYGVPADLLFAWERGKATPTPTELTYLQLIAADPDGVAALVARRVPLAAAE